MEQPVTERPGGVVHPEFCDHVIPEGWAHCRCGLKPLDGADLCWCIEHLATSRKRAGRKKAEA
jgi:hypothetical protein